MTFINPITGAALPAAQAQERLAADKVRQIRRQQVARRVTAPSAADRFEHVVESAEAVSPVGDDLPRDRQQPPPRRQPRKQQSKQPGSPGEPPHIDVRG